MNLASPSMILKKSFRAKIFAMAALIIISISAAFTVFFIHYERITQTAALTRQAELLASLLAHNSRLGVFAGNIPMIDEVADGIMRNRDVVAVEVYGAAGTPLVKKVQSGRGASSLPPPPRSFPVNDSAPLLRSISEDSVAVIAPIFVATGASTAGSLFFEGPSPPTRTIGSVRVVLDTARLRSGINRLVIFALLSMVLFLVLGSLCAYVMARGISRPLTTLLQGVNTLGITGIYSRVPVETRDEIGSLAVAFNSMVENLERREHETRKLEEQLLLAQKREAEEEWEQTFDTVPDLMVILDPEGRIVRVNRSMAEHCGLAKEDMIGKECHQLQDRCGISRVFQYKETNVIPETGFEGEIYEQQRDCWYWLTVSPLKKTDGERPGAVYVARDITQRKRTERDNQAIQAKLIQTNKMASLGLLVSGMAHEVNNPNSNIMFTAHLLTRAWKDTEAILDRYRQEEGDFRVGGHWYSEIRETLPHHIAGISENSRRIEAIIKNLKDFVRKGKADLSAKMDINRIVSVAISLINNQIKKYTTKFDLQMGEDLPPIKGNPQQLEQVFINVIMNALQALPDRNRRVLVVTSLETEPGFVSVTIEDEGCGMTPEVKASVFEPFFSTKLDSGGTGLGLPISKFILDEHNARIHFDSEPDRGTTVTILFPIDHTAEQGKVSAA